MSAAWWQAPDVLVPFDTETTGVNPEEDRIVSAYLGKETWLVDPGVEIPEEAAAVHGITTERVRQEGVSSHDAVNEIVARLDDVVDAGRLLVGMNLAFDLTLLDREARRAGTTLPSGILCVDVMVLDKKKDPYRRGGRRLSDLAAVYGVTLDNAHDAEADAEATREIAWTLLAEGAGAYEPYLLHHMQVQWRWQQQASLREYFERTGKPYHDVHGYWPVKPRTVRQ